MSSRMTSSGQQFCTYFSKNVMERIGPAYSDVTILEELIVTNQEPSFTVSALLLFV